MQFILEEDRDGGYHARTEINVREADVTIAIATNFESLGEKLTKDMAKKHKKVYIAVSPYGDIQEKANKIVPVLNALKSQKHSIALNIAGNGLSTMKGVLNQEQCDDFTYNLLSMIVNHPGLDVKIKSIRSGGQTGFDEAGLKAGIKLKIDTIGRDLQGDRNQTREEVFKRLGIKQKTKIFVDMDGVLCDFKGAFLQWKKEHPEIEYPQSQFGFFSNLEPISGAIEAFKRLQENFDVYILTRPSIYNLMCYTEKADWIKRHLGFHVLENLIMCCDKSIVKGEGAFLIDDTVQAGQLDFEGEFIHFGSEKFSNWDMVLKYLIK